MSYDTHLKNEKKKQNEQADADIARYEKDNEALKDQINATLDASADASAGVYRQEIEQAPLDSRALYDQNAMREAIDRKKIQESLANMGMTDSGLSSSMQTALTVQKSRADNSVRAAEQQRIRAAESAIDQIFANNELQKAQKGIEIDQDTAAYARTRRENANAMANQTATALHNAEVEAATAQYKASLEADQEWMKQQLSGQQNTAKLRSDYVKLLMTREENPLDPDSAWQEAYKAYPDAPVMSQAQYTQYAQYLNSGYSSTYAYAMTKAYDSATAQRASDTDRELAIFGAVETVADEEIRKAGLNGTLQNMTLTHVSVDEAITLANDMKVALQQKAKQQGVQLTETALAYALGKLYGTMTTPANADRVGQALAAQFGGANLEVALYYAGLE